MQLFKNTYTLIDNLVFNVLCKRVTFVFKANTYDNGQQRKKYCVQKFITMEKQMK